MQQNLGIHPIQNQP